MIDYRLNYSYSMNSKLNHFPGTGITTFSGFCENPEIRIFQISWNFRRSGIPVNEYPDIRLWTKLSRQQYDQNLQNVFWP